MKALRKRTTVLLRLIMIVGTPTITGLRESAMASAHRYQQTTNMGQYVARIGTDYFPRVGTGIAVSRGTACAADDSPNDPAYFKQADGRCSGE